MLNINTGTSKSNLHKARLKLKKMILEADLAGRNTNYNTNKDYIPIVALNATNFKGVFLNRGIRG
jgi:RNA polymerase sigma-70 factor (ECF subfamily)